MLKLQYEILLLFESSHFTQWTLSTLQILFSLMVVWSISVIALIFKPSRLPKCQWLHNWNNRMLCCAWRALVQASGISFICLLVPMQPYYSLFSVTGRMQLGICHSCFQDIYVWVQFFCGPEWNLQDPCCAMNEDNVFNCVYGLCYLLHLKPRRLWQLHLLFTFYM